MLIYNQNIIMMNLRDRDNFWRKDKRPVPKVSFVQSFDCISTRKVCLNQNGRKMYLQREPGREDSPLPPVSPPASNVYTHTVACSSS